MAVVIGDSSFEEAIAAQIDAAFPTDLVAFVGAVPLEIEAVGGEAAIERRF